MGGMLTLGQSPWAGVGLSGQRECPLSQSCPSDRPAGAEEPWEHRTVEWFGMEGP